MSSSNDLPIQIVKGIFKVLHGNFGAQFLDKFRTGKLTEVDGELRDAGTESAMKIWSSKLAGLSNDQIRRGIEANYDYPPSCDEFRAACLKVDRHPPITEGLLPRPKIVDPEHKAEVHNDYLALRAKLGWR